ncbi:MAG: metallophosphoesterase family protein [Myxococcales bacterium]|nr:metallophosphoesterase family protein [Myxococcales bacterium]
MSALLAALAGSAAANSHTVGNPDFGPYLGHATSDAVSVSWRTSVAGTSEVAFGPTQALGQSKTDSALAQQHEVRLTGLQPGTRYYYTIRSLDGNGQVVASAGPFAFRTAAAPGQAFKFVFLAEVHEEVEVARFDAPIAAFGADFQIQPGDNIDEGHDLNQWQRFFTQGAWYPSLPLFNTMGNHNFDDGNVFGGADVVSIELLAAPGNERWYAFRYGHTLFLGLDSNHWLYPKSKTDQLTWLDAELTKATDGVDDPALIVAFFHVPPYSSCGELTCISREVTERPWVRQELVPRFEKHKVDLVLNGHDKIYERSEKGGVTYIEVSSGAAPRSLGWPNGFSKLARSARSALLVAVDGCKLDFEAVDDQGGSIEKGQIVGKCQNIVDGGAGAADGGADAQPDGLAADIATADAADRLDAEAGDMRVSDDAAQSDARAADGARADGGAAATTESGCGCSQAVRTAPNDVWPLLLVAVLALFGAWRRRRRCDRRRGRQA